MSCPTPTTCISSMIRFGLVATFAFVATACGFSDSDNGDSDSRSCETVESSSQLAELSTDTCYEVPASLSLDTGHWTLEPGTTLYFHDDAGLTVRAGASLEVRGDADDPVILRGDDEQLGDWRGIQLLATGPHHFEHATIAHAGGSSWDDDYERRRGAIVVGDNAVDVEFSNIRFKKNEYAAVTADAPRSDISIGACEFTENDTPLRLQPDHIADVSTNNLFDDNRRDVIYIHTDEALTDDASWGPLGVPYRVEGAFVVEATLQLGPGTRMYFDRHAGIDVDGGLLLASGTDSDPVVLRGHNDAAGYWRGIRIRNTDDGSVNQLQRVGVFHAGSQRWDELWSNSQASVLVHDGGHLDINHTTVTDGGYHGLSVRDGVVVGCNDLTFEDLHRHAEHAYEGDDVCF